MKTATPSNHTKPQRRHVAADVIPPADALESDWQGAQTLLNAVDLHLHLALAAQILLGWQLANIKKTLGFRSCGRPPINSATVAELRGNATWREHVESNLAIPATGKPLSGRTADRLVLLHEAAKSRLKKLGHEGAVALLQQNPNQIAGDDYEALKSLVAKATDGMSQRALLEDLSIVKVRKAGTGGDLRGGTDDDLPDEIAERQLAFAFFSPLHQMARARAEEHWQLHLAALPKEGDPETGDPGLVDLKQHLELMLADVKQALKAS